MNTLERLDAWLPLPEAERMLLASVQTLARTQIAPRAEHYDRAAVGLRDEHRVQAERVDRFHIVPGKLGGAIVVFRARRDLCAGESLHAREEHALLFGQRKPGVQTFKRVHAISLCSLRNEGISPEGTFPSRGIETFGAHPLMLPKLGAVSVILKRPLIQCAMPCAPSM